MAKKDRAVKKRAKALKRKKDKKTQKQKSSHNVNKVDKITSKELLLNPGKAITFYKKSLTLHSAPQNFEEVREHYVQE